MPEETDDELIRAYIAGDESAFPRLVERHLDAAYTFALRFVGDAHDAEDIVQDSFVKAWKNLRKYSSSTARFKTWFMRIVRNSAIDHLRKRRSVPFSALDDDEGNSALEALPDEAPLPDELAARLEDAREVEKLLAQLPLPQREVMLLRYQSGLSFEEIGAVVGTSQNTVKSRHRRGLHRLRAILRI